MSNLIKPGYVLWLEYFCNQSVISVLEIYDWLFIEFYKNQK